MALTLEESANGEVEKPCPALRCVTVEMATGIRHLLVLPADASGLQLLHRIEAETGVSSQCSRATLCDGLRRTKFKSLLEGDKALPGIPSYLNLCFPLLGGGEGDEEKPPAKKGHWEEEERDEDSESSSSSTNSDSDTNVGRLFIANGYQSGPHSGYQSGSSSSGYPDNFSSPSLESNSVSSEEESSPQASRRNPDPSSLAAETSSCDSSDGSSTGDPPIKKSGGESSSMKLSTGMSDSGLSTMGVSDQEEERNLPTDPMKWSCDDVLLWLDMMAKREAVPEVDKRFFCMSGIGVAFIPRHGFVRRLGSKGLLFYQDFHHRLKAARCVNS